MLFFKRLKMFASDLLRECGRYFRRTGGGSIIKVVHHNNGDHRCLHEMISARQSRTQRAPP